MDLFSSSANAIDLFAGEHEKKIVVAIRSNGKHSKPELFMKA